MNDLAECFGANLARHRRLSGLSQDDVAIRAGTHRTEVSQLEWGLRLPRLDTAVGLAAAVEADLGELVEDMTWISGSYRPESFVHDSQRQPAATQIIDPIGPHSQASPASIQQSQILQAHSTEPQLQPESLVTSSPPQPEQHLFTPYG